MDVIAFIHFNLSYFDIFLSKSKLFNLHRQGCSQVIKSERNKFILFFRYLSVIQASVF